MKFQQVNYIFEIEDTVSFLNQLFIRCFKGKKIYDEQKGAASVISKLSFKTGKGKEMKDHDVRELKAKNQAIIDEIEVC